ncbi:MAG: LamG-like jellyroll fold domain-containing protein [Pirellulales bacterium]
MTIRALNGSDAARTAWLLVAMACGLVGAADASVVGLWRFNEASGNATDSSGNNNTGTFVGSNATRASSKAGFGNALSLTSDQVNRAYVQVPGNFSLQVGLNAGNPWSVTAWAFENSDGLGLYYNTYGTILSQKDPAVSNYGLEFQSGANGDEQYYMWHGNNTALQKETHVAPTLDVWNHYAYVYNGSDYIMYINGTERYRATVGSQSLNFPGYTGAVEIGGNLTKSPSRNWDGLIDDVAIFNQALTPSEISMVMGGNFASFTSPLPVPGSAEWGVSNFGLWNTTTNWLPIVAPSTVTTAVFGNRTSEPTTVVADTAVTVKGIQFNHTQPYAIAGAGSVTIDTTSGNGSISVLNAGGAVTEEFQLPVNLAKTTDVSAAAGTVLDFDHQLNLNGNTLNVSGAGRVNINNDSTAGAAGSVINSGLLGGAGTIKGSLTNSAGGKIAVDISGTGVYGVQGLTVTGTATLAGALDVSLLGGFVPAGGNTFTVLSAASIVNNGLTLTGNSAGFSLSVVGGTNLVLTYAGSVPGDYNGNGIVDAADYTKWRDTLNANVTPGSGADGSGNGVVDQADYTYWRNRFGNTSGSGALADSAAVPEPAAWLLVMIGLAIGLARRGTRQSAATATALALGLWTIGSAQATVLTFEGDVSNFNAPSPPPAGGNIYGPLGNGSTIVQEYGDYVSGPTQTNVPTANFGDPPYWYNFNYGNNGEGYTPNVKVANQVIFGAITNTATRSWLSAGNASKVSYPAASTTGGGKWYWTFTADAGHSVTLISTDLVRFNTLTLPATVNVYSGNDPMALGSLLYTSGSVNVSNVAQTISPYVTANSLTLEFVLSDGDALYNFAADNIVFAQPGPPALLATWNFNGSGTWSRGQNWTPVTVLNGNDRTAVFGNVITAPSTVVVDTDITVKKLQFNHNISYHIAGSDELTLQAASGNAAIELLNAGGAVTHSIDVNTTLASNTDVSLATGTTLEFNNRVHLGAFNLNKTGAGTLKINNVVESTGGSIVGGGGAIGGSGSFDGDLINLSSTIAPGNSPGVLTIGGDYQQAESGTLQIELGGVARGSEYDVLKVGGDVTLHGGTLEVVWANQFAPAAGDTFDILDFAAIAGQFSQLQLPGGINWDLSRLYVDGTLTVASVVPEPGTLGIAAFGLLLLFARKRKQAAFAIR